MATPSLLSKVIESQGQDGEIVSIRDRVQAGMVLTRPKRIYKFNCTITKGLLSNPRKLHHKTC